MRLSDFLGATVVDQTATHSATCTTSRWSPTDRRSAVRTGAARRRLVVGRARSARASDSTASRSAGPWLLKVLFARRRLHRVPWGAIAAVHDDTITLSISADAARGRAGAGAGLLRSLSAPSTPAP